MADVELTTVAQEAAIDPAADKFPYIDVSLTPDATRYATVDNMLAAVDASTTEVLTGTSAVVAVTPNALAALWEQGSDIASAGTISVGEGGYFVITGTTTITDIDFATDKAGRKVWLKFNGILTLTHHATTLILPTGANIVTAAGDIACFISEGSDNVRCVSYTRASGAALVGAGSIDGSGSAGVLAGWVDSDTLEAVAGLTSPAGAALRIEGQASGDVGLIVRGNTSDDDNILELRRGSNDGMNVSWNMYGDLTVEDRFVYYKSGADIRGGWHPTQGGFMIVPGYAYCFTNGNSFNTIDAALGRNAAGVLKITNGSTGIRGFLGGGTAVASATAMPLPTGRVFHVTGTTTITSITATNLEAGVVITLIFDDILTFTDGNNLVLAGNFVTSANDTISLAFDGTNFYETSRSVN